MKVVFTGDRNWQDVDAVRSIFEQFYITTIIEGEARGLDTIVRNIGIQLNINVIKFPADWIKYKKAAGPIRNRDMLAQKPDAVIAFHDDIKNSKGTKDCVSAALKLKYKVYLVRHINSKLEIIEVEDLNDKSLFY